MKDSLISILKILIKHKFLFVYRKESKRMWILVPLFTTIAVLCFYYTLEAIIPEEHILLIPLIILIADYTLKFFFHNNNINIIPYWIFPFKKESILRSILLLEIINLWTLCDIVILVHLLSTILAAKNGLDNISLLFFLNYGLIFILNSYYILFIKMSFSPYISYLLYTFLLLPIILIYLLILVNGIFIFLIMILIAAVCFIDKLLIKDRIHEQFNKINF